MYYITLQKPGLNLVRYLGLNLCDLLHWLDHLAVKALSPS